MASKSEAEERLMVALADRYSIESEIGSGGMATVYLAQDLKHDRKVAVKVLKPELAAVVGAERFLSEIKTTANLQNPHILPLFDSGEAGGFLFYVMPYVEGESLREKLDREKHLPVEEAIRIAGEVADALDHAHRRGVIHRDIKPGNILLHEGRAQVADFGIALAVNAAGGARLTETGLSVGTPSYMSPEQASGEGGVDARSDVYSLAAMVYEMLSGQPPYTGPTAQAIVAKILTETPEPIRKSRPRTPFWVEEGVDRALERIPADRHASAGEFAQDLRTARRISPQRIPPHWGLLITTSLVAAGLSAVLMTAVLRTDEMAPSFQSSPTERAVTFTGTAQGLGLSPDGEMVAYMTEGRLVTRDIQGGAESVVLEMGQEALGDPGSVGQQFRFEPEWHSNGLSITFGATIAQTRFRLASVGRLGGNVTPLTTDFEFEEGEPFASHRVFPDGDRILVARVLEPENARPWLLIRDMANGSTTELAVDTSAVRLWDATPSPNGRWIAYIAEREDRTTILGTVSDDGTTRNVILESGQDLAKWREMSSNPTWAWNRTLRWVNGDRLYFRRHSGAGMDVWVLRIDPESGEAEGAPRIVYPRLPRGSSFDVSSDADRMAYTGGFSRSHIHLFGLQALEPRGTSSDSVVTKGTGWNAGPRISPTGDRIAFISNNSDVLVTSPGNGVFQRITVPYEWQSVWSVAWAPAGEKMALHVETTGGPRLLEIELGSGNVREIQGAVPGPTDLHWSPDGRHLIYGSADAGSWVVHEMQTGQEVRHLFGEVGGEFVFALFSEDGREVLGLDVTTDSLWAASVETGDLTPGGFVEQGFARRPVAWEADGTVVILDHLMGTLWAMPWTGGEARFLGRLPFPCMHEGGHHVSSDGLTLACSVKELEFDVRVVEDFDSELHTVGEGSGS